MEAEELNQNDKLNFETTTAREVLEENVPRRQFSTDSGTEYRVSKPDFQKKKIL